MAEHDDPLAEHHDPLAELDRDVERGRVSVVDYWRRRAAIEAGRTGPVHRGSNSAPVPMPAPGSRPAAGPGHPPGSPTAGELGLVPSAPSYAGPDREPPPRPSVVTRLPATGPERVTTARGEVVDAPFAPPEGAVNLSRSPPPDVTTPARRRWGRRR